MDFPSQQHVNGSSQQSGVGEQTNVQDSAELDKPKGKSNTRLRPGARPSSVATTREKVDFLFKIVLIGNSGVGKSCLLTRFADNAFTDDNTATIGVDFKIQSVDVDGKQAKLQIWDSAGQERFRALTSAYYRGAHAVAVVFDVTCYDSISAVENNWLNEIDRHCNDNVRRILIGNKSDLSFNREVSFQKGKEIADTLGMLYLETSAKTSDNVQEAFENIIRDIFLKCVLPSCFFSFFISSLFSFFSSSINLTLSF